MEYDTCVVGFLVVDDLFSFSEFYFYWRSGHPDPAGLDFQTFILGFFNCFRSSPFTSTRFNGHIEVVKYLVENGADVNVKNVNWVSVHLKIHNICLFLCTCFYFPPF